MSKIILTGGAGFIGSCLLSFLNRAGFEDILVVDRLRKEDKWKNLVGKKFQDYVDKDEFLQRLGSSNFKADLVIHFGACSSTTERDADYVMQNNFNYSQMLASWASSHQIRLIYASSAATYGDIESNFDDSHQQLDTLKPQNIYAFSKHLFDQWMFRQGHLKSAVGLKFFNVFGPNEYHKGSMRSVVHKAYYQAKETGSISLFRSHRDNYRDGEQKRDFIYVKDVCKIVIDILERPDINGIINLGTGQATSWNELAGGVFKALGKDISINYIDIPLEIRDRYQYFTEANTLKLREKLPDLEFTPLDAAIADYVNNYLANQHQNL